MTLRKKKVEAGSPRPASANNRSPKTAPSDRDIARRAYELFIQRGGEHGRDMEDWLLAKRELTVEL